MHKGIGAVLALVAFGCSSESAFTSEAAEDGEDSAPEDPTPGGEVPDRAPRPHPACKIPIDACRDESCLFRVDIRLGRFEGRITVDGRPAPEGEERDYTVVFRDQGGLGEFSYASVEGGDYRAWVPFGTYDVFVEPEPALGLPTERLVVARDVRVASDEVLDLDIRTEAVSGLVLWNGEPPPQLPATAWEVSFDALGGRSFSVGVGGDGTFSARVPRDIYDVYVDPSDLEPLSLPVDPILAKTRVPVVGEEQLVVDVTTVELAGRLRWGPGWETNVATGVSELQLTHVDSRRSFRYRVGTGGTFRAEVPPGVYDLAVVTSGVRSVGLAPGEYPVASGVTINRGTVLDLVVEVVKRHGRLNWNDWTPLPAHLLSGWVVEHRNLNTGARYPMDVDWDDEYVAWVPPGVYDIHFEARSPYGCEPEGSFRVASGVHIEAEGEQDLAVVVTEITGTAHLKVVNERALVSSADGVVLRRVEDGATFFARADEQGAFEACIPEGDYDIDLYGAPRDLPGGVVYPGAAGLEVRGPAHAEVIAEAWAVVGQITRDGGAWWDEPAPGGLSLADRHSGEVYGGAGRGGGVFKVVVPPGLYLVRGEVGPGNQPETPAQPVLLADCVRVGP